jgi:putative transposase
MTLFEGEGDYAAFLRTLSDVQERPPLAGRALRSRGELPEHRPMRVLAMCLMPNHFHLLLWPREDGELSEFMRLLTVTHTQRWHAAHGTAGTGPLYQGRFKSFPVQRGSAVLAVARYVERNAVRAGLERRPGEGWRWSSAAMRRQGEVSAGASDAHSPPAWLLPPGRWPAEVPGRDEAGWREYLASAGSEAEEAAIRLAISRSSPLGSERWVTQTAARLGLESTLRPRGRPRVRGEKGVDVGVRGGEGERGEEGGEQ